MRLVIALLLIAFYANHSAMASFEHAPPSFSYKRTRAIFVDFSRAVYDIEYNLSKKEVEVVTTIHFEAHSRGFPLFDLIADPSHVTLDGSPVSTEVIQDPDDETNLRVIKSVIETGHHVLKIKNEITTNVVFSEAGVASAFWMGDLSDRKFLEQYLPTNLEFDQYKMKFQVKIIDPRYREHVIKTNGKITRLAHSEFEITYPDYYTTSSVFFHLLPEKNPTESVMFYFPSRDGRLIPVDIYTTLDPKDFASSAKTILEELETDYGPFPHDQIIIYGAGSSGGMEYSGATVTSLKSLAHELFHSYHARALMPANGNAGWMDEAIASFRDRKYVLLESLSINRTILAGHSVWMRLTDRKAYKEGAAFLSWIAYRMNEKGLSFKVFLRDYFNKYKFTTVTTELFRDELIKASGLELKKDFSRYIYGRHSSKLSSEQLKEDQKNPHHHELSEVELMNLTMP